MNIDAVAAQIRQYAPVFNGNVAGAAGYANGVSDQVWLPLPAAYVIPDEDTADDNESQNGLWQRVRERISVIVVISTPNAGGQPDPADRRGQAAAAQFDVIRASIFKAILNWRPNEDGGDAVTAPSARGIQYVGAKYPEEGAFDRARAFRQFVFELDTTITDADGWQPSAVPLADIRGTVASTDTGAPLVTFDAPLPQ